MELKLGDLVDNFNRSSKILYAHRSSNALYWLPKQITSYHWLFKMRAKRAAASVSTKERQKKFSGHMIKCLLTELGRAGRENIWLSVRTHGPRCARSVRPDLEPNIFPSGPPTQSISTYYFALEWGTGQYHRSFLLVLRLIIALRSILAI